jgi:2-C-methyl-D-erythritol 4-phosphate cytidylyltransferase
MRNSVIITAAGLGSRMKSAIPKQFLLLGGKPILMRTIEVFFAYDPGIEIILVLDPNWKTYWLSLCKEYGFSIQHLVVEGGNKRFLSVQNAINHATGEFVAVHDGVRPLVSKETIDLCFQSAQIHQACVPILPIHQSIRKIEEEKGRAVDRNKFFTVQTPQIFSRKLLIETYGMDYQKEFTDEATAVESIGYEIATVIGNEDNLKITTQQDLKWANFIFNENGH